MAQGKAFTPEQREQAIQSLKEYLEMGFSRNKACEITGLLPTTLATWVSNDETLRMKLQSWENMVNVIAIKNIKDSVIAEQQNTNDTKKENSWKWAERKVKEFSPKQEVEHSGVIDTGDKFTDEERAGLLGLLNK